MTLSDPYDALAAERSQPKVERACAKSRGYRRCLSGELHPPRRRLCKDGATRATRDRFPDRADITPLERRGCRDRYREASCRPGLVVSRRTMDGRWWKTSVLRRLRRCIQSSWRVTKRANFITNRFVPKPTHTRSTADSRRLQDSSPTGRERRPSCRPSYTAHESDPDPAEMGLTRSPEEEPEAVLLGTIATGPWAVGTVTGTVIGGHRGRR